MNNLIPWIRRLRGGDFHHTLSPVEKMIGKDFVYAIVRDFTEKDLENLDISLAISLATDSKDVGNHFWSLIFDNWDKSKPIFKKVINEILSKEGSTEILKNLFTCIPPGFKKLLIKSLQEDEFPSFMHAIYKDEQLYRLILDAIYFENDIETFYQFFNKTIRSSELLSHYPNFIPEPFVYHLGKEFMEFTDEQVEQLVPIINEKLKHNLREDSLANESEIAKIRLFLSVLSPQNLYEFFYAVFNGKLSDPFYYKRDLLVSLVDWKRCCQWKTDETWIFLQMFCHNGFILFCDKVLPLFDCISAVPAVKLSKEQKEMISVWTLNLKWRTNRIIDDDC